MRGITCGERESTTLIGWTTLGLYPRDVHIYDQNRAERTPRCATLPATIGWMDGHPSAQHCLFIGDLPRVTLVLSDHPTLFTGKGGTTLRISSHHSTQE